MENTIFRCDFKDYIYLHKHTGTPLHLSSYFVKESLILIAHNDVLEHFLKREGTSQAAHLNSTGAD